MEISREAPTQERIIRLTTPDRERACPNCQAVMPVYDGYTTWCSGCDWNLDLPIINPFESRTDKFLRSLSKKLSAHLFDVMVAARPVRTRLTPTKFFAYLLSLPVHAITVGFVLLAIWPVVAWWPHPFGFVVAIPCLLLAWVFAPRVPQLRHDLLPRAEFPELYRFADQIAGALGGKKVDGIIIDPFFNASYAHLGWRQQRILRLGLPFLGVLDPQEKVALLSHELAHEVNGDPQQGFIIGGALHTLMTWYNIVDPSNRPNIGCLPLLLLNLVSYLVVGLLWLWIYALLHLLWRESQRAEYLADYLAAQVSGTDAQLRTLEKSQLGEIFRRSLMISYLQKDGDNFFTKFHERMAKAPIRELERVKRIALLDPTRYDTSHPPIANRVDFLKKYFIDEAKVTMTPAEVNALERELLIMRQSLQEQLFQLDSLTFRSLFDLNW